MSVISQAVNFVIKTANYSPNLNAWNVAAQIQTKQTPDAANLLSRTHWLHFNYDAMSSPEQAAVGFSQDEYTVWAKELRDGAGNSLGYGHVALEAKDNDRRANDNMWANDRAHTFAPRARVRGVIERLPSSDFFQLDTDLQNGVVFERKRVTVLVPMHTIIMRSKKRRNGTVAEYQTRDMFVRSYRAWMYVGVDKAFSEGSDAIDAGYSYEVASISRPASFWIGPFYHAKE
jgi:hypothetical protein